MRKNFRIILQFLQLALKILLEYRFNVLVRSLFMFVYLLGMYFLISAVFLKTTALGGWDRHEVLFLLGFSTFMWSLMELFFFNGLVRFMISGVSRGELDFALTKPVNPQLYIALSWPEVAATVFLVATGGLSLYELWLIQPHLSFTNITLFVLTATMSFCILYCILAMYATTALYMTRSVQILRMMQTLGDQANYPTSIYPFSIQVIFYTLIPNAFMAFVPASFLLGRGSVELFVITLAMLVISFFLNNLAWREGLKRYSSASS